MPIAQPSIFSHLLFEQPWPVMVVLVGLAAVFRVIGRRERKPALNWTALGLFLAAIGVYVLAWAVVTPREALMASTRQLVKATSPLDMGTLQRMIPPHTPILGAGQQMLGEFDQTRPALEHYPITRQHIQDLNASAQGQTGMSVFSLYTHFRQYGLPISSRWALKWKRLPNGQWQVMTIYWLRFNRRDPPSTLPR